MSDNRLRLFVAADITRDIRELLASTMERMRGEGIDARWVKPENLHLTLKFIGEYGEEGLDTLLREIHKAAGKSKPFDAVLGGCGAFPSRSKARVIWVGMSNGVDEAAAIARKLDARLEKVGIKRERRQFRGHLTLARLRRPQDCTEFLEDMSGMLKGLQDLPFHVEEIMLFRSILKPQGPTYVELETVALGGE
ncbi:MAG: RNA 2',3'-cyclic phosphodiesterase [Actinobacteria bacterium]|nr:RNA 2',3'-cyclic phosphodiesterase [Actinomycetota bacterium]